jgi:hypothetical protein
MQKKIRARTDSDSTIHNDPIELLKAIEKHSGQYEETQYGPALIYQANYNFLTTKQREDESLIEYSERIKSARDILKEQVGSNLNLLTYAQTLDL